MLTIGRVFGSAVGIAALIASAASGQRQSAAPSVPPALTFVPIRPIEAPARPLPPESESANVTRFSFIAYGDTRSAGPTPGAATQLPGDGDVVHPIHSRIVDAMIARIRTLADTPFPVRFVIHSGDAVLRGANAAQWNVSFTPIVDRLIRDGRVSYFFSVGNHDVTGMPAGDPSRMMGLHNALTALSRLIPPEGSPRRLSAYPTYSIGFGNTFLITFDSNVASDRVQLVWVTDQLERLDRSRYHHVVAFFHHPPFSSGPHGGYNLEPASAAIRSLYMPLFRKHHVRLIVAGHDHLYDHWVERYVDHGAAYRIDSIVTGGGGAPIYTYSGEPDLEEYLAAGAVAGVRVEHVAAPGPTQADNPHHFVVIRVDGDALSLEVVGLGEAPLTPYKDSAIEVSDQLTADWP